MDREALELAQELAFSYAPMGPDKHNRKKFNGHAPVTDVPRVEPDAPNGGAASAL